jgi:hypothetical protein
VKTLEISSAKASTSGTVTALFPGRAIIESVLLVGSIQCATGTVGLAAMTAVLSLGALNAVNGTDAVVNYGSTVLAKIYVQIQQNTAGGNYRTDFSEWFGPMEFRVENQGILTLWNNSSTTPMGICDAYIYYTPI